MNKALGFADVTLIPQYSEITSRSIPNTTTRLSKHTVLQTPIISSNMDTVTESAMAIAMWKAGGIGALHRFMTIDENVKQYQLVRQANAECYVSLGVKDWKERTARLVDEGATRFIIDIAHGHSLLMKQTLLGLRDVYADTIEIMAGNIATPEAVYDLTMWGASSLKCGVSSGSICKTRMVTGHGVPMFSCILECSADSKIPIIADGGIRYSSDIIKSFVAGADMVMIGSLLSGTDETPGEVQLIKDRKVKSYRGMASKTAQSNFYGEQQHKPAAEGVETFVELKGPVADIIHDLTMGLKSGMSYCNARNLDEIYLNAKWREQSHFGYNEGLPHILGGK